MVWTVIYSDHTAKELLTDGNDYSEAFQKAHRTTGPFGKYPDARVIALLKGRHVDTIRFI